jgi:hypothetical protein
MKSLYFCLDEVSEKNSCISWNFLPVGLLGAFIRGYAGIGGKMGCFCSEFFQQGFSQDT